MGHPMLVELKNGETLNGHLVNCDTWMNLTLKEVVQTNPEGTAFFRLPEVYVRGNNVGTPMSNSKTNHRAEAGEVLYKEVEVTEGVVAPEVGADEAGAEVEEDELPRLCESPIRNESVCITKTPSPRNPHQTLPGIQSRMILPRTIRAPMETPTQEQHAFHRKFREEHIEMFKDQYKSHTNIRRFSTTSKAADSKVRFIRRNPPPRRGKRGNAFEHDNNFFSSDHNTSITALRPVVNPPDSSIEPQVGTAKKTWHSPWRKVSDNQNELPTRTRKSATEGEAPLTEGFFTDTTTEARRETIRKSGLENRTLIPQYPITRSSESRIRRGRKVVELDHEELYEELRRASSAGDYPRAREVLKILIQEHGVKPDRRHYQALLLANTDAQHGSPIEVARVVDEMDDCGITMDSAAYHAILKVLAVHPDYIMRRHILEELRQRWFNLSNEGWHDVIVGLLRDKQLESAVETLQSVQQEGIRILPWLYDMLIFNLCDAGEHDEALSVLRFRCEKGEQLISGTVWHYLLDSGSRAYHHPSTLFAWRNRVGSSYLNPSSGVCLNVLETAARHADFRLAADVVRVLGNRNQGLKAYHYESLIEACVPSELRIAFTLLALMTSAGIPCTVSSTRPIFLHLRQLAHLPDVALSVLRQAIKQQQAMPAEAVNVIMEAYIYHGDFERALDVYKTLHTICPSGPVTSTFNTLFRGCRSRKETAMFLASEMVALKVGPNALTYDRLILVCLAGSSITEDFEDAWRYFEEMREMGWWPRPGTAMALARQCCIMRDERIWRLQGERHGEDGITGSAIQRLINEDWMESQASTSGRRVKNS
ncbi:MAG: hypothetical protein Q9168_003012 [Polycauliona sp. 1 TL-2023]